MKIRVILSAILLVFLLLSCGESQDGKGDEERLVIYCGVTMSHPVKEVAELFEKIHGCRVVVIQGGSEDLYKSLRLSKKGDLYLPGSPAYREKYLPEGLLADYVHVGDNQAALMVQKGNPKNISADITNLASERYAVVIGNPESGSIGLHTKKILEKKGIYDQVVRNSVTLAAASRNINRALAEEGIDLAMNWRATATFAENKGRIEALVLPESVAPKKKLLLNLLTFSENPELAKKFMLYSVSPAGQAIFMKYAFLDGITPQGELQR